jgi:hypothetical protein
LAHPNPSGWGCTAFRQGVGLEILCDSQADAPFAPAAGDCARSRIREINLSFRLYNKMQAMLDLALKSDVLDDLTFGMADDVRKRANKAAHGTVPTAADCQERLEQTRAVLRHLYESDQQLMP